MGKVLKIEMPLNEEAFKHNPEMELLRVKQDIGLLRISNYGTTESPDLRLVWKNAICGKIEVVDIVDTASPMDERKSHIGQSGVITGYAGGVAVVDLYDGGTVEIELSDKNHGYWDYIHSTAGLCFIVGESVRLYKEYTIIDE